jgi:two-component system response regulator QseB
MRILLIEDDAMIGSAVRRGLAGEGYAVDWVVDGDGAEGSLRNGVYHVVVLDLGLPNKDGLVLLRELRARNNTLPVLITSARDRVADRIAGLNAGADDYLLKPFDLDELIARVRALIRRHVGSGSAVTRFGPVSIDAIRKAVTCDGRPVSLSPKEFAILEALMQRPGAVLSRRKLEESVYGWDDEVGSNAIEVHLHNLRKKLGSAAIKNVRGVGYRVADN